MKNQSGATLTEVMIASTLLAVLIFIAMTSFQNVSGFYKKTSEKHALNMFALNLIDEIKGNFKLYIVNYESVDGGVNQSSALDYNNLPFRLGAQGKLLLKEECTRCEIAVGYIIQPITLVRGLFQVTLRVAKRDINTQGLNAYKNYVDHIFAVSTE